jgi:hypothetical protein
MAKNASIHGSIHGREEPLFDPGVAEERAAVRRGRLAAVRAWERRRELGRLRQLELGAYFEGMHTAAEAELEKVRRLHATVLVDRRLDELLRLRRAGMPLGEALAEVDRRFPPAPPPADNDNANARPRPAPESPSPSPPSVPPRPPARLAAPPAAHAERGEPRGGDS